jgi:hypothetical protein
MGARLPTLGIMVTRGLPVNSPSADTAGKKSDFVLNQSGGVGV